MSMDRIEELLHDVLKIAKESYGYEPDQVLAKLEEIVEEQRMDDQDENLPKEKEVRG